MDILSCFKHKKCNMTYVDGSECKMCELEQENLNMVSRLHTMVKRFEADTARISELEAENVELKEELEYFVPAFMDANNELIESANRISELEERLSVISEENARNAWDVDLLDGQKRLHLSRISELEVALKFYEDNCDCCRHINIEGADSEGDKDE